MRFCINFHGDKKKKKTLITLLNGDNIVTYETCSSVRIPFKVDSETEKNLLP